MKSSAKLSVARWSAIAIVLAYFLWACLQFNPISPNGVYNYLARGWASGTLHVPIAPDPRLLAASDPYDPQIPEEWKFHDLVLFEGRYYVYHGAAPALLFFYPYLHLTGKDLPEPLAVFVFVSLGFLANAFTLRRLRPEAPAWHFLVLGLSSSIPFLLHRIWVYEVAIAAAYALASFAIAFHSAGRFRASGVAVGFLALARPHLLILLPFLGRQTWPYSTIGLLAAGLHNYLRFGSLLDFGLSHLIAGPGQQYPHFSLVHLLPSLYLFLLESPRWSLHFPFLEITNQAPITLPPTMVHENIMGALWLAPWLCFQKPMLRLALPALLTLGFLSLTGWASQRYLVDFLPLLVLASLAGTARNRLLLPLSTIGILCNLLLHWQGPYNAP